MPLEKQAQKCAARLSAAQDDYRLGGLEGEGALGGGVGMGRGGKGESRTGGMGVFIGRFVTRGVILSPLPGCNAVACSKALFAAWPFLQAL